MHDLRSALQFIILTMIARLLVYFIVRFIESLKPRNAHFIIAPSFDSTQKPLSDPESLVFGTGMVESVEAKKGSKKVLPVRMLVKFVWVNLGYYGVVVTARVREKLRKTKAQLSLKLMSEIIGLITAIVSLVIMILNYFLK
ncbi:MAG TPA: hypothetical protein VEC37_00820 [Bacillota bacterium]|nr:hypothetical protein [Bacillota bacterium]